MCAHPVSPLLGGLLGVARYLFGVNIHDLPQGVPLKGVEEHKGSNRAVIRVKNRRQ